MPNPFLYAAALAILATPAMAADLRCEQLGSGALYCYPAAEAQSQAVPGQRNSKMVLMQLDNRAINRALAHIRTEMTSAPPPQPQVAYHPDPAIVQPLPTPDLAAGTPPSGYLRAAAGALDAGDDAMATSALEMAETRLLDRSVPLGDTDVPAQARVIREISAARAALLAGDVDQCARELDGAIRIAERHRM